MGWPDGSPALRSFPDHPRAHGEIKTKRPFPARPGSPPPPGEDRGDADHQAGLAPLQPPGGQGGTREGAWQGPPPPRRFSLSARCRLAAEALDSEQPGFQVNRRPSGRARAWSTVSMVSGPPGGGARESRTRRKLFTIDCRAGRPSMPPMPKTSSRAWLARGESAVSRHHRQRLVNRPAGNWKNSSRRRPIAPLVARSSSARSLGAGGDRPPGAFKLRQVDL